MAGCLSYLIHLVYTSDCPKQEIKNSLILITDLIVLNKKEKNHLIFFTDLIVLKITKI